LLKSPVNSKLGEFLYEKPNPSVQKGIFRPYEGKAPYPMNKELNLRLENSNIGRSYNDEFGKYYQGTSGLPLFDFIYSPTNQFGVNQDSYRVVLIDKPSGNKVGEFLKDYFSTIKLFDSVDFGAVLVNILSGAVSIQSNLSSQQVEESTKFELILQRILGLCFDSRSEIDVSGISKVAELDGVDDKFFDLTEIDLRNIQNRVSNIQLGVVEFEDCENVKLPVDFETITDELIKFRNNVDVLGVNSQVDTLTQILDTIYQNPDWKVFLPTNFDLNIAYNKEILKQIPIALASVVLTPKVLFPILTLLQVVERDGKNTYNQPITSANTIIQSGNTVTGGVDNIINNSTDFLKVFQSFNIQVVSKIGEIFLRELYNILKKDLINLLSSIIRDVENSKRLKKYKTILRLVNILLVVSQLIRDYRKCKSLINDILLLLNTIFGRPDGEIPLPLLLLTKFLPGTSPERATINTFELLQSVGLPTGPLPDGSANLMGIYNLMVNKGSDDEEAENGKVEGTVVTPTGIYRIFGKKR
jgi:hypothetical protein